MFVITSGTNATDVIPFTGKETAPAGYRVISIHWKERKATDSKPAVAKKPSVSLCAPQIVLQTIVPTVLQVACQDAVNEFQDSLARSIVESGKTLIPFADLDAAAVSTYCSAVATSKRLNGDSIGEWFEKASGLQDQIIQAITVALNLTDPNDLDMTKIIKGTQVYRGLFVELAAPKPAISTAHAEKLLEWAKKSTDTESAVYTSIISKLNLLTKRTEVELLI